MVGLLSTVSLLAGEPLLTITFQNSNQFKQSVNHAAAVVVPDQPVDVMSMIEQQFGMAGMAGIDPERPWQFAIWHEGGQTPPFLAVKVPVSDFDQFKENLAPDKVLRGRGDRNVIEPQGDYAAVAFKQSAEGELPEADAANFNDWKALKPTRPEHLIALALKMNDGVRQQLTQVMAMAKASIDQGMSSNDQLQTMGYDPESMKQMFELYFAGFQTFLNGFQQLNVGLSLDGDDLVCSETIAAVAGSDLASCFKPQEGDLTGVLPALNVDSTFAFAAKIGKNPELVAWLKKLTLLSYQMQGVQLGQDLEQQFDEMLNVMMPLAIGGSGTLENGITFSGVYRFPETDAQTAYAQVKKFFDESAESLAGEDKMYSAINFQNGFQTIDGTPVDRFTMTINFDHPMFKMPGQKENFQALWPDGKIEFDYAIKDNAMWIASPGQMEPLLRQPANKEWDLEFKPDNDTVLIGQVHFLDLVKQGLSLNPMTKAMAGGFFAMMDTTGTEIQFKVDLNQKLTSNSRVPLKIFQQAMKAIVTARQNAAQEQ